MADHQLRPLIGITGPQRGARMPRLLVALGLWLAGGRSQQLYPSDSQAALASLDGLVVTGGHDVDPVLYAAAPEVTPKIDRERDRFESAAIDQLLARQRPLLGICRGAQLLNIRRGGSLFQELRSRRQHTSNRWTILPLKTLRVAADSKRLAHFVGCARCRINSLHNQGIDRLGTGLRIAGRDLDDIVQAVEDPEAAYVLGVQWHPEFLLYLRRQRQLFRDLVAAARATAS
ncbi:gamma-glutamyl-gamma-aminobutyrate hydrolase family protein [Rhabdochromatium marinum]|uniref:gamma-glutamyl-gamma-aminobutyrate hydrolase family protein n=1 Tax=Rhabdochromatium marinum TaxID=48729 RepID=UPI0019033803|nr:type 1 glutamine amidotransferase [Rhabdochromatium marinum]MBK1650101.1 peptidase C26 [Rhabdochromatium marinum]